MLFVIKSMATAGGAEKVLAEITAELSKRAHETIVASFDDPDSNDFHQTSAGVIRERLGRANVLGQGRILRKLIKRVKPDVAVGFMHSAFVPLAVAAAATGVPVIASEHTSMGHYRLHPWHLRLIRLIAPLCARFTAQSERIRDDFPSALARKMAIIPNPVSVNVPNLTAQRPTGPVLLCVGRLRPEKGQRMLVEAFASLATRFADWTLRLAGDGPCYPEIVDQVTKLGLSDRIQLAGPVEDVAAEYSRAELVATPSLYESFGLATAEALACGVPAVGFADCPGTNEIIENGINGVLVSGEDRVAALADGLSQLMGDESLRRRLGAAGPATMARFSLATVIGQWERLIVEVAASRRSGSVQVPSPEKGARS